MGMVVQGHVVSGTTTRRQIQPGLCLQKGLGCKSGGCGAWSVISVFGIPQTHSVQLQKGLYLSV